MAADLSFGILRPEDWPAAMGLSARAFFDEPYVQEMFGADALVRYAGIHARCASATPQPEDVLVASYAGTTLVGVVKCSPPGACHMCGHGGIGERPSDATEGLDWEFEGNVRRAHAEQGDHAWVSRVAIEPALHGLGIGRQLMAAALDHLDAAGAPAVLLECQDHRVRFYQACGFTDVGTFPDPVGPDAHLMRSER